MFWVFVRLQEPLTLWGSCQAVGATDGMGPLPGSNGYWRCGSLARQWVPLTVWGPRQARGAIDGVPQLPGNGYYWRRAALARQQIPQTAWDPCQAACVTDGKGPRQGAGATDYVRLSPGSDCPNVYSLHDLQHYCFHCINPVQQDENWSKSSLVLSLLKPSH